jgi:hypothetical protein
MKKAFPIGALLFSCFLMACLTTLHAAAGTPIQNNNYRLDLTRTVTSGSTRKIGMGGAFVGLAEGNAAIVDNPAAVAYRARAFLKPWEFDAVLGTLITSDDDTDNSGSTNLINTDQALIDAGVMAQYKNFGIGGVAQITAVSSNDLPDNQEAQLVSGVAAVGYTFMDRQLAVGLSVDPIGARVHNKDSHDPRSFQLKGTGYGAGMIWHPDRGPWRFGAAYKSSVSSDEGLAQSSSPIKAGNLIVPSGVLTTDSLALGTAYEWDKFPLWKSRPAIGTFDINIFGQSPADANGAKAFLTQTEQPVGQKTVVTLHTGLEVEAVPRYLRVRAGTYYEPSRYDGISARQHITGGFELRLTKFNIWGERPLAISYAIDSADRYLVSSISIWLYTFTVPVGTPEKAEY